MIQIYYPGKDRDFNANGDAVLTPESCEIEMNLNGEWELTMEHPIDGDEHYRLINDGAVLAVPTPVGSKQLYRIYQTKKTQTRVTAYARPIFWDCADDTFFLDTRPTDKSGQEVLDILMEGTKYSGETDIAEKSTAYYINKSLLNALQSDDENSFLNRWGGEIIYDNFKIIINHKAGSDNGIRAEFGRNLNSIQETVDMDDVITRIIPMAYNGYMLDGDEPWVDSKYIDNYPIIYHKVVQFEDVKLKDDAGEEEESFETLDELRKELKRRAKLEFDAGCDLPSMNYVIDMIDLSRTEEYKDYQDLEEVHLGDTIHCRYKPLDIDVDAKVIRINYDCILQKTNEIELGDEQYDYFSNMTTVSDSVSSVLDDTGKVRGDSVQGVLDALTVRLAYQKNVAQKQDVRAILFEDTDTSSSTYGALAIGTLGLQISTTRQADGEWDWTTAITAEGIIADTIAAGTMKADRISGGTLKLGGTEKGNGNLYVYGAKSETEIDVLDLSSQPGMVIGEWGLRTYQYDDAGNITGFMGFVDDEIYFTDVANNYAIARLRLEPSRVGLYSESDGGNITIWAHDDIDLIAQSDIFIGWDTDLGASHAPNIQIDSNGGNINIASGNGNLTISGGGTCRIVAENPIEVYGSADMKNNALSNAVLNNAKYMKNGQTFTGASAVISVVTGINSDWETFNSATLTIIDGIVSYVSQ